MIAALWIVVNLAGMIFAVAGMRYASRNDYSVEFGAPPGSGQVPSTPWQAFGIALMWPFVTAGLCIGALGWTFGWLLLKIVKAR